MTRLIEARGLSVRYQGADVLQHVDFQIDGGEIVTVVGPNGSGKSTLMKSLTGALQPSAGTIARADGLRLGYVPQKLSLDPTFPLTVSRFLDLPRRAERQERDRVLDRLGIRGIATRPLSGLSGGQYQRALLARALLARPQLLILDEATQGMDQRGSADFYALIADLRAETGVAVLMVSHDLHVVMSASDRVICLNGHVCCEGSPEIVRSAPEYRALFGTGTHGALALYRHSHDHSHDHDAGHHNAHEHFREHAPHGSEHAHSGGPGRGSVSHRAGIGPDLQAPVAETDVGNLGKKARGIGESPGTPALMSSGAAHTGCDHDHDIYPGRDGQRVPSPHTRQGDAPTGKGTATEGSPSLTSSAPDYEHGKSPVTDQAVPDAGIPSVAHRDDALHPAGDVHPASPGAAGNAAGDRARAARKASAKIPVAPRSFPEGSEP
ncbi:hypothetical protein GCM10011360_25060 [Primorskyibacter flagellatus]|uniref:ABC transporter domain-containing protein n=1 Tax=Primorskyibacter flagellatus TaxID=1387277 RepID=A0A917EFG9_9RHOB|nr:hypothetical protein GCM10011360_25060 [Primorskyibacter flagellatus]